MVADDILVYGVGDTDEQARMDHDNHLIELCHRAQEINLKLNKDKMRLHIGHRIAAEGNKPDVAKVTAVKNIPEPKSAQEVRRFLGMCNYLSRFLPTEVVQYS